MSDVLRHYFRREKPRFHQFLAHCIVRRALRCVPAMRRSDPPVIGIVAGENPPIDEIQDALTVMCLPKLDFLKQRHPESLAVFLECPPADDRKPRELEQARSEFLQAMKNRKAIFAVVEREEDLPDLFRIIADAVVHLGIPTPQHIRAAFRYCVGVDVGLDEAEGLTGYSLFDLTLAASRGKGWRRVLQAVSTETAHDEKSGAKLEFRLEDLAGLGEAADWGRELARDLADWRGGKLPWSEVDRGVLVAGPPGTGKTTFAKALANSCGVNLVAASLAQWQAAGHLGDLLKAMRRSFAEAKKNAPCILFIDEFDAVGDRATARGDNALYIIEKINGLLECLDGIDGREGVVVVGACNHPNLIDPALLRPGRMERTVRIPLPDAAAREQILKWHLNGCLSGEPIRDISDHMEGCSGADIEKLVRDAKRIARRNGRALYLDDLTVLLPQRIQFDPEDLRRMAVHEAGHAVVHAAVGVGEIVRLSINPDYVPGRSRGEAGALSIRIMKPKCNTREDHEAQLMVHLAGLAAEELVLGAFSDGGGGAPQSDLAFATQLATEMEASVGLGGSLVQLLNCGSNRVPDILLRDRGLRRRVEETLENAFEGARTILVEKGATHQALVEALLERHDLQGSEVLEIISGAKQHYRTAV